jgi:hypothetical protein
MIELDSGYLRGPGEVCPKTPLHIREMTSKETIQQTKEDIAILQEKLKKLEELDRVKSSAEKAYCAVYGEYPRSCARWNGFLTGYDLGYVHATEGKKEFVPHQEHFGLKLEN